jgi:hypothetical protein
MGVLSQALTYGQPRSHSQIAPVSNSRIFGHQAARLPINQSRVLCRAPSALYQLTFRAPGADIELRLPWKDKDHLLEWLIPHTVAVKDRKNRTTISYEEYRFPGKNGLELPADTVINRTLIERKIVPPRRPVCGWLLAIGGMMARDLFSGGWVDAILVISTRDRTEFSEPLCFWSDRLEHRRPPLRIRDVYGTLIGKGLFEGTRESRLTKSAVSNVGLARQRAAIGTNVTSR